MALWSPYTSADVITSSSSLEFSPTQRDQIRQSCSHNCWICEARNISSVHVLEKTDSAVLELEAMGLLTFDLDSVYNGIGLCPNCHMAFSDTGNPGWTFFPSELDFFIDFEKKDRERRSRTSGSRRLPTATDYRQHQVDNGLIAADELGGLYSRYYLRPFLSEIFSEPLQRLLSQDKPWQGAPMASLSRAMAALGSLYVDKIPDKLVEKLVELRKLYMSDEPEAPPGQSRLPGNRPSRGGRGGGQRHQKATTTKGKAPSRRLVQRKSAPESAERRSSRLSERRALNKVVAPVRASSVQERQRLYETALSHWTWSPQCTSEEVMEFQHTRTGEHW